MSIKKRTKKRLGKRTKEGYQYSTSISLNDGNLLDQVEEFEKEEEVREIIEKETGKIRDIINKFKKKERNTLYYYILGKKLRFLNKPPFVDIKKWSVFRLIYEFLPEILPHISNSKVVLKHIAAMFYISGADKKDLVRATWDQWYEMAKFKELFTKKKFYKRILTLINSRKISGPRLRSLIYKKLKRLKNFKLDNKPL